MPDEEMREEPPVEPEAAEAAPVDDDRATDVEVVPVDEPDDEDAGNDWKPASPIPVIIRQEFARALRSPWTQAAFLLVTLLTVIHLNYVYRIVNERGLDLHTWQTAVDFVDFLRWGVLFVAAAVAGPTLLEDYRKGALELYFSRAVTPGVYLFAKGAAVTLITSASLVLPVLVYYGFSLFMFETQPDGWNKFPLHATGYALLWALPVAAMGLGLSSVARSGGAAALLLFGGFAAADLFMSSLLEWVAHDDRWSILSPFSAHSGQVEWLFPDVGGVFAYPSWWGLTLLGAFLIVGWGLVIWKRPRPGAGGGD